MSGASPPGAPGPGGADPSMDDILASIRRILNEEEVAPQSPGPEIPADAPPPPPSEPNAGGSGADEDDGVLVLDEAMLVTPPAEPVPEPAPALAAPVLDAEPAPLPLPFPIPVPAPAAVAAPDAGAGLLAPESAAAAASSVGALLRTISDERTAQVHRGGPTIEDVVREEMRPLLKVWLDQHLPPMVERLVRQEIERVTGRAVS